MMAPPHKGRKSEAAQPDPCTYVLSSGSISGHVVFVSVQSGPSEAPPFDVDLPNLPGRPLDSSASLSSHKTLTWVPLIKGRT
jgi:hypothetical protein